ncbi:MAG: ester cyclase [Devosia sp.]|nr:ester cyclase [Devosia sp.]
MITTSLAATHRNYIACLNRQNWTNLGRLAADNVRHNGRALGLDGYRDMLENDFQQISDLRFAIWFLLADPSHIAAQLWFEVPTRVSRDVLAPFSAVVALIAVCSLQRSTHADLHPRASCQTSESSYSVAPCASSSAVDLSCNEGSHQNWPDFRGTRTTQGPLAFQPTAPAKWLIKIS